MPPGSRSRVEFEWHEHWSRSAHGARALDEADRDLAAAQRETHRIAQPPPQLRVDQAPAADDAHLRRAVLTALDAAGPLGASLADLRAKSDPAAIDAALESMQAEGSIYVDANGHYHLL